MATDLVLGAVGVFYLCVSALLFVFGTNLMRFAWLVARNGRPQPSAGPAVTGPYPMVTVQLPIYNELYVAARAIDAAAALDYPPERLEIQVLDDSTDETSAIIAAAVERHRAAGVSIAQLRRRDRSGYKAGALQAGLGVARGELVAIFDADFVPPPDYLRRTVGHFADERVAFVQARWGHLNRESSWLTRMQALAIDGHFLVEQAARGLRDYWFNFNGTAGIWRAAAIRDAGGWTADTLTEDLDLSYRAHLRGWRAAYRPDLEVPGELPAHVAGFRRQQHRWARGSLECAHRLLPQVWQADAPRATRFQATTHLCGYTVHLLLLALTLVYPLVVHATHHFGAFNNLFGLAYPFALASVAPGVFFAAGQHQRGERWWAALPRIVAVTVVGSGLMVNTARAALQIVYRPNPVFERTAKFGLGGERADHHWTRRRYQLDLDRIVLVELAVSLYSLWSASVAFRHGNWGIFVFAVLFAVGLAVVALTTVAQAVALWRHRRVRAESIVAEQAALELLSL
jgi:cellulose synthase/poly-beta-1,6-N-acetylglucosamine synthase-like glycosyltransferase